MSSYWCSSILPDRKAHRNGIKKPQRFRHESTLGVSSFCGFICIALQYFDVMLMLLLYHFLNWQCCSNSFQPFTITTRSAVYSLAVAISTCFLLYFYFLYLFLASYLKFLQQYSACPSHVLGFYCSLKLNSKPNGNKQSHCRFLTAEDVKMCSEAFCSKLNDVSAGSNKIFEKILIYP